MSVLSAYPAGLVTPFLPFVPLRHLWTALSGVVAVHFAFKAAWLHLLLPAAVCYVILAGTRGIRALDGWRHLLSAALSFGYLVRIHINRTPDVEADSMDAAVLQMVAAVKLYTLAYTLYDGFDNKAAIQERLKSARAAGKKGDVRVCEDQLARSLPAPPTVLEYVGYLLNPATLFVGPSFEFKQYKEAQEQVSGPPGYLSGRYIPALLHLVQGIAILLVHTRLIVLFPVDALMTVTADQSRPLQDRLLTLLGVYAAIRTTYYNIWRIAEGSALLAGFGFRPEGLGKGPLHPSAYNPATVGFAEILQDVFGFDLSAWLSARPAWQRWASLNFGLVLPPSPGSPAAAASSFPVLPDWEGATNINCVAIETRRSVESGVRHWNIHTQSWLERYVFRRVQPFVGPGPAKVLTFFMSAFWHGFNAGYYLTLGTFALLDEAGRALNAIAGSRGGGTPARRSPLLLRVVVWVFWMLVCAFCASPIFLLDVEKLRVLWGSFYYCVPVVCVAILLVQPLLVRGRGGSGGAGGAKDGGGASRGKAPVPAPVVPEVAPKAAAAAAEGWESAEPKSAARRRAASTTSRKAR